MREYGSKKKPKQTNFVHGDHFKVYITDADTDNNVDNLSLHSDEKSPLEENTERIAEEESLFQSQQLKKKESNVYRNLEKEQHHSDYRKFYGKFTPQESKEMHQRFHTGRHHHYKVDAQDSDKLHHGGDFDKPKRDIQRGSKEVQSKMTEEEEEEEEENKILEEEKVFRKTHTNDENKKEESEPKTAPAKESSRESEEEQVYAAMHGGANKTKAGVDKSAKDREAEVNKKATGRSTTDDVFSVQDEIPTESSLDSYEKNLLRKAHNSGKNATGDAANKDDIIELLKQYGKLKDEVTELTQENDDARLPVYDFNGNKKSERAHKRRIRHRGDHT